MSALIIMNMQNDLCESNKYVNGDAINIYSKINKLRNKFKIVIFIKKCYSMYNNLNIEYCIKNTPGYNINDNLIIDDNDIHIDIATMELYDSDSAFYIAQKIKKKSSLDKVLKNNNIKNIYICGISINGSIFTTCIDAYRKYNIHLVKDACIFDINNDQIEESILFLQDLGIVIS